MFTYSHEIFSRQSCVSVEFFFAVFGIRENELEQEKINDLNYIVEKLYVRKKKGQLMIVFFFRRLFFLLLLLGVEPIIHSVDSCLATYDKR